MRKRTRLEVEGVVQGVGFRPFVWRLATSLDLAGFARNTGRGVTIEVEGSPRRLRAFHRRLTAEAPPLSRIQTVKVSELAPVGEEGFRIVESAASGRATALIPPDVATCDDCLRELFDAHDPRHRYPFINCTNCGPRYTIIRAVPYDRSNTTMRPFALCGSCESEYRDPANRRYHAEPLACPRCGPKLSLVNARGEAISSDDPIRGARTLLLAGRIVAIKGLGGFHLACDARSDDAVRRLRQRKLREEKPFAVMSADLEEIRSYAHVSSEEASLLTSPERPIVLLEKRLPNGISREVAPRSRFFGAMLPYTPIHALLFDDGPTLVMTSGNLTDEPIAIDNAEARKRLADVADAFLEGSRDIFLSNDDSVARVFRGKPLILRRSRGYVPRPVTLAADGEDLLAVGAHLKNVVALVKGKDAFLSQHIGDLETAESLAAFKRTITHLAQTLEVAPRLVACDLHPDYFSTRYARSLALPVVEVQHHHAHIAAVIAEKRIEGKVLGIALDGTGYGSDGTIWGGEFLVCDLAGLERVGHLEVVKLPGGDASIKHPNRTALAYLHASFGTDLPQGLALAERMDAGELRTVLEMLDKNVRCIPTSSCGRLFDAVSAVLGVADHASYEGQPAIELEGIADLDASSAYETPIAEKNGMLVLRTTELFKHALLDHLRGEQAPAVSARFHRGLAAGLARAAKELSARLGLKHVALSGGCMQNTTLLGMLLDALEGSGLAVSYPEQLPPNDGGIALGQAAVARARQA
ncbi:MAG: carbamoyltransferase HypF [Planctomycetota bacterium]